MGLNNTTLAWKTEIQQLRTPSIDRSTYIQRFLQRCQDHTNLIFINRSPDEAELLNDDLNDSWAVAFNPEVE